MRAIHRLVLGSTLLFAAAACGGDGTGPGGGGGGSAAFSAKIDGQAWAADAGKLQLTLGSATIPGSIIITGTSISGTKVTSISLILGYLDGPATYPLGVNQGTTPGGTGIVFEQQGASVENRVTPFDGASGSVVIVSRNGNHISGTFSFVAKPQIGSTFTGDRAITGGTFEIDLPSGFTSVPVDNHGSSIKATIGGVAWNGATVTGLGGSGSFVVGGLTTTIDLHLTTTTPVTSPGTYSLLGGVKLQVTDLSNAHSWGGVSGDVGTVVFSTVTSGRVAGTFSGTLQQLGAGGSALVVSGGSFDIKVNASP